jgi:hypothetical protein
MEATPAHDGNLGDRPQSGRLRMGVVGFGVALLLGVIALEMHAPRPLLALLFVPFCFGAFGVFQGLLRTCPGLAARGMRDAGDGPEKIVDASELRRARWIAVRVVAASVFAGALCTAALIVSAR